MVWAETLEAEKDLNNESTLDKRIKNKNQLY